MNSQTGRRTRGRDPAVGRHVRREHSRGKVDGSVEYTDDVPFEGLYAAVTRSSVPHGELVSVETGAAESMPGVAAVVTGRDLERADWISPYVGPVFQDQPVLAIGKVRYVGEPVAAVVAESQSAALEAADAVEVTYDPLETVETAREARADDAPRLHDRRENVAGFEDIDDATQSDVPNDASTYRFAEGDVEAAFERADVVVDGTYATPPVQHVHLEPFVTVANYDAGGESFRVTTPTQYPHFVRKEIARILDLPRSDVRVDVPQIGGSYGAKTYVRTEPLTAALSRVVRKPVKLRQTAGESFDTAIRDGTETRVKTGVTADGDILARRVEVLWDTGAYADCGPRKAKKAGYTAPGPYAIENVEIVSAATYTNKAPAVAMRGYGVPQTAWAIESHTDEVAAELGMDPYELRLRNVVQDGGTYNGAPIGDHGVPACLREAVENADWFDDPPEDPAEDHLVRGRGVAIALKSTGTPSTSEAVVFLDAGGSLTILTASVEIGQGSHTTLAQLAADELGIDLDRVTVSPPDTGAAPFDMSTTSSRTTFHMGNAVLRAVDDVIEQATERVADWWGVAAEELTVEDGAVIERSGERSVALGEVVDRSFAGGGGTLVGTGYFSTEAPEDADRYSSAFWMSGATVAEVLVDVRTGTWRVERWVNAADAGTAIDPGRVRGQITGAAVQGLGHARSETIQYEGGQPVNASLFEYRIPAIEDVPAESTEVIVESDDPSGPRGAKGVGESTIITVPPAIGNAIRDATGVRPRELPITPGRLLRAIRDSGPEPSP